MLSAEMAVMVVEGWENGEGGGEESEQHLEARARECVMCLCAWVSRGWRGRWHGCSTLSTLDTCSYVRSQESGGSSSWDWAVSSAVSVCIRGSGRTSVGICRASVQVSPARLRHEGHHPSAPRCRSAGLEPSTAIHHPLIHQHPPRNQPASATLPFCSVPFRSAACLLFVCHASSTLRSLSANHRPRPNLGLSPHLHPCPHILILLSTHTPSQNV
jgi:hypothetical protein